MTNATLNSTERTVNVVIQITCLDGLELIGRSYGVHNSTAVTCQPDGFWSEPVGRRNSIACQRVNLTGIQHETYFVEVSALLYVSFAMNNRTAQIAVSEVKLRTIVTN